MCQKQDNYQRTRVVVVQYLLLTLGSTPYLRQKEEPIKHLALSGQTRVKSEIISNFLLLRLLFRPIFPCQTICISNVEWLWKSRAGRRTLLVDIAQGRLLVLWVVRALLVCPCLFAELFICLFVFYLMICFRTSLFEILLAWGDGQEREPEVHAETAQN